MLGRIEAAKNLNFPGPNGVYAPQANGGMPADENVAQGIPAGYPSHYVNIRTNGLNEADEMSLYQPRPLLDSPYGPTWNFALEPALRSGPGKPDVRFCQAGKPDLLYLPVY